MNKRIYTRASLMAVLIVLCASTSATDLGEGLANESDSKLLHNKNNLYQRWNGIGKIFLDEYPACTASLLDTRDSNNKALGPAYLLTAAHCVVGVSGPEPETPFAETVRFNYFNDTSQAFKSYTIKKTVWQNYRDTDLAIMELDAPLEALLKDGITPLRLASGWASEATDVLTVGAPEQLPDAGLRLAACVQTRVAGALVEGTRAYQNALKNRCRDIRPGSSGTPVIERDTGRISSVLATSTFGATADQQCFDDAPCEVRNGHVEWSPDSHYSHAVSDLTSCFIKGVFTNADNACTNTSLFKVTDIKYVPTQYVVLPVDHTSPDPVLEAAFSLSTSHYRYKTTRDAEQCFSPHGYSGVAGADTVTLKTPISRETGMHFLCIIGVDSADQRPSTALMKSTWITPAQLVERTPVRLPEPTLTLQADWNYIVEWRYSVPTLAGARYYSLSGEHADCSTIAIKDYVFTLNRVRFRAEHLPLTLCSINQDAAGRHSMVRADLLALP